MVKSHGNSGRQGSGLLKEMSSLHFIVFQDTVKIKFYPFSNKFFSGEGTVEKVKFQNPIMVLPDPHDGRVKFAISPSYHLKNSTRHLPEKL